MRTNLTNNEKIARQVVSDSADFFAMNNTKTLDEMLHTEAVNKLNDAIDEVAEKIEKTEELNTTKAEAILNNLNGVAINTTGNKMLVQPYAHNPFRKMKTTSSGLIIDAGGFQVGERNPQSGEIEELPEYMEVAEVQEVGPEVTTVKPGDIVFYIKQNGLAIPFYDWNLKAIYETQVAAFLTKTTD